jgi:hypothetical protein
MTARYFYDFEFEENGQDIIPISLGMVSEDNRELNLINCDYLYSYAFHEEYWYKGIIKSNPSPWLIDNVIEPLLSKLGRYSFTWEEPSWVLWGVIVQEFISDGGKYKSRDDIELWGYYAAYDHVCLAQLFGCMGNLPEPIPMFTHEIMQLRKEQPYPPRDLTLLPEHNALADAKFQKLLWETWSKQESWWNDNIDDDERHCDQ